MRRLRISLAILFGLIAIGAVGAAWLDGVPDITAEEATDVAAEAFEAAGLRAAVDPDPSPGTYVSHSHRTVEVWTVRATVRSALVEVRLARSGAQPVSIDDRSADGSAYVLTEHEYEAVASGIDDPALSRVVRRNIALTLAAVLVVALALALALLPEPRPQEP
jgi:hypothetical protein